MSNTAPVENEQSAEASQQTSAAISSTFTKRPIGILESMYLMCLSVIWSKIAVFAAAGVTQFTSTPDCRRRVPSPTACRRPRCCQGRHPRRPDALHAGSGDRRAALEVELVHSLAAPVLQRAVHGRIMAALMAGRLAGKVAFITAAAQ